MAPAQEKKTEIPATYETVTKRIKIAGEKIMWAAQGSKVDGKATGASLCLQETPAVYKTVKQKKIETPASIKIIAVPAEYKVIKKRKLVAPAIEKKIEVPAITDVVSRNIKVYEESIQWHPVLCETNMSGTLIAEIQHALKKAGYYFDTIDGKIGGQTLTAIQDYQSANELPRGGLTLRTLEKLGVKI